MIATQEQQEARARECLKCPFYVKATKSCGTLAVKNLVKGKKAGDLVELEGRERRVRLCGCYLPAKWAARWSECPLPGEHKRWNRLVTKEDIDEAKLLFSMEGGSRAFAEKVQRLNERLFDRKKKKEVTSCGSCVKNMLNELKQLVEKYESE